MMVAFFGYHNCLRSRSFEVILLSFSRHSPALKSFAKLKFSMNLLQTMEEALFPFILNLPYFVRVSTSETLKNRATILQKLKNQIARGIPIIGAGAGTGISAKFEEEGGADIIVIYNSGRFRMAGRGSLAGLMPYKDANAVVLDMASEVLPVRLYSPRHFSERFH